MLASIGYAAAYTGVALLPIAGLPAAVVLGLAGAPLAFAAAVRLMARHEDTRAIVPAQVWTLGSVLLLALGMSAGLVFG